MFESEQDSGWSMETFVPSTYNRTSTLHPLEPGNKKQATGSIIIFNILDQHCSVATITWGLIKSKLPLEFFQCYTELQSSDTPASLKKEKQNRFPPPPHSTRGKWAELLKEHFSSVLNSNPWVIFRSLKPFKNFKVTGCLLAGFKTIINILNRGWMSTHLFYLDRLYATKPSSQTRRKYSLFFPYKIVFEVNSSGTFLKNARFFFFSLGPSFLVM